MSKQAGRMSQSANDFLGPMAVTNLTVTDVGTNRAYNDGAFDLTWTLPAGSPPATIGYHIYTTPAKFETLLADANATSFRVEPLSSGVNYTVTVVARNASGDSEPTVSSSVKATTVPQTPSAPTVTAEPSNAIDSLTWTLPNDGGKALTDIFWNSDESPAKTGTETGTTTNRSVSQEAGTSQSYRIRARNANGDSEYSSYSSQITSFSFTPFSFVPYSFTPYSFTPYSFTPYSFTPFSFTPYAFVPYSFLPATKSLGPNTLVLTSEGLVAAKDIQVGDTLVSVDLPGLGDGFGIDAINGWSTTDTDFDFSETTTTTVTNVLTTTVDVSVLVNGELFSGTHYMLSKREGIAKMIATQDLLVTDELWSTANNSWVAIDQLIIKDLSHEVVSINCEPYDMFFTDNFLVYDGYQVN